MKKLAISYTNDLLEAGLDEAGRGCLAGPVVAAAVILSKEFDITGLDDSKKLSVKKRDLLEVQIKENALAWAVAEVSPKEIDELNILRASFLAMHRALDQIQSRPDLLLVDGNRFVPYQAIGHECIIKGDGKYAAIAAASILAKTHRDRLMADLAAIYPAYGWERNAGYPTKQHREAIRIHGPTEHHRMTFTLLSLQKQIAF